MKFLTLSTLMRGFLSCRTAVLLFTCFALATGAHADVRIDWPTGQSPTVNITTDDNLIFVRTDENVGAAYTTAQFNSIRNLLFAPSNVLGERVENITTPGRYYIVAVVRDPIIRALNLRPDLGQLTVNVTQRCLAASGALAEMDIDGDGRVLKETDGVLLTRYAAGYRGNALIEGAVGANASRCSVRSIEPYLAARVVP
ncbi:MAG: hypothetical protein ACRDAM_10770 [Casimicrobium sp.]